LPFDVGDRVEARFGGHARYYPGVVAACHAADGTYQVAYDDGDSEARVGLDLMRVFGHDAAMHLVLPGLWLGDLEASMDGEALAAAGVTHVVDLANTVHADAAVQKGAARYVVAKGDASCDWATSCPSVCARLFVRVDDVEDAPLAGHWAAVNAFVEAALELGPPETAHGAAAAPSAAASTHAAALASHAAAVDAEIRAASDLRKAMMHCGGTHPLGLSASGPSGRSVLVHCVRGKSRSAATTAHFLMASRGYSLRQAMRAVTQARPGVNINVGFKRKLQQREAELRPGQPPSVQLQVASRKEKIAGIIEKRRALEAAELEAAQAANSPASQAASPSRGPEGGSGASPMAAGAPLRLPALAACAVAVLRSEAKRRGLAEKGTHRQLLTRLQAAFKEDAAAAEAGALATAKAEETPAAAAEAGALATAKAEETPAAAAEAAATELGVVASAAEAAEGVAPPTAEAAPETCAMASAVAAEVTSAAEAITEAITTDQPEEGAMVEAPLVAAEEAASPSLTAGTLQGSIADID
jgi:hypothetical protein